MAKMIQLRHVSNKLHQKLKARTAMKRLSLSDCPLRKVVQIAERPTLYDLRGRLESRESIRPRVAQIELIL